MNTLPGAELHASVWLPNMRPNDGPLRFPIPLATTLFLLTPLQQDHTRKDRISYPAIMLMAPHGFDLGGH